MGININDYMRLNLTDVVLVCISTLIICLIAKHFFWDVIVTYFQKRTAAIQADIDAGTEARQSGEAYKQRYEAQMADARKEAHALLEDAKRGAQAEKKELLAKARQEAEGMKTKALQDIEREKLQAQKEMKQAITDAAFDAAGKIIEKELDEEQQQKYVDEFIDHAGDDTWQA